MNDTHLVNELIQTLEGQNKTKIHQIFLLTQQLNHITYLNKQLKQHEALLTIQNTQQSIALEQQRLEQLRLQDIINQLESMIKDQQTQISYQQMTIDQFKNKHNEIGNNRDELKQESVYNLLMTNYFEDTSKINQSIVVNNNEQELTKLKQLITERDHRILELDQIINSLHQQILVHKIKSDEKNLQVLGSTTKWQIQSEQILVKNKYLQQSILLAQQRNIELSSNIKQLVDIRYGLEIRVNTLSMNEEQLTKQLECQKSKNILLSNQISFIKQKCKEDNQQLQLFHQTISDLQIQLLRVKQENINLLSEHDQLKKQLNSIMNTKVDIQQYMNIERQHESLKIDFQLLQNELHIKNTQLLDNQELSETIRDDVRNSKEELSHLISINFSLTSEISILKERLFEEQQRNRQAMRLERANRSLMRRVETLETSMYQKKKNSSTKIDSLHHLPSVLSIPSQQKIINESKQKPILTRIKSEQNIGKVWNMESPKVSSRVKNIFSSRMAPSINQKPQWKNLEDRIESLKHQNEDLKRHLSMHKL